MGWEESECYVGKNLKGSRPDLFKFRARYPGMTQWGQSYSPAEIQFILSLFNDAVLTKYVIEASSKMKEWPWIVKKLQL